MGKDLTNSNSLIVGFVTMLVIGTDLFVVSPLLPQMSAAFGVSVGTAGLSVTVFSLAYVIGAPLFGMAGDKVGHRLVLTLGLISFGVANLLTAGAPTFPTFMLARALTGIAAAASSPSVYALVGHTAPAGKRGAWMSTVVAGFLISLTTGAPTGMYISEISGWREVFLVIGILAFVVAALNFLSWPARGAHRPKQVTTTPLSAKLRAVSVTGTWGFSVYAFYTYLGAGLQLDAGFSSALTAAALIIYGIGAVVGSLSGGRLADRFGPGRIATASLILLSILELVSAATLRGPHSLIMALLGVFAVAAYPCLPAYQARLVENFPGEGGSIMAWNSCVMYLGTSLGAACGGLVLSRFGFSAVPIFGAIIGILGSYLCLSWRRDTREVHAQQVSAE